MKYSLAIITSLFLFGCSTTPLQDRPSAEVETRSAPKYPMAAVNNKTEGFVTMSFDVNESGKPINIEVIKSEPSNVFDEQAKSALSRWEYHPKVVDGIAQVDTGLDVTIEFKRSDK